MRQSKLNNNFFSKENKDSDKAMKKYDINLQPVKGPMIIKESSLPLSNNYYFKVVNNREEIINNK